MTSISKCVLGFIWEDVVILLKSFSPLSQCYKFLSFFMFVGLEMGSSVCQNKYSFA